MENKPIMHRMGKIQLKYKTFFCSSRAYFVILRGDRKKKKKTKAQLPVGFEPKPLRISRSKLNHRATANVRVIESNCRSSRTLTSVTEINPSIFFLVFEAEVGSKLEKEKKLDVIVAASKRIPSKSSEKQKRCSHDAKKIDLR